MTASSGVVLSNLIYVIAAVAMIVILTVIIALRQRKPKSVEANMESFNKGLRALAPNPASPPRGGVSPPQRSPAPVHAERRSTVRRSGELGRDASETSAG